jgi:phenylalanyl-tRNA synthetase alpha chain
VRGLFAFEKEHTMSIFDELEELRQTADAALEKVGDLGALAEWKSIYLGKQSPLARLSRGLGGLPPEERREVGQRFNSLSKHLESAHADA